MAKSSGGKSGGIGFMLFNFFWLIMLTSIVFAFFKVNGITDVITGYKYSYVKSLELGACVNKAVKTPGVQCSLSLRVGDYEDARDPAWGERMGLPNYSPNSSQETNNGNLSLPSIKFPGSIEGNDTSNNDLSMSIPKHSLSIDLPPTNEFKENVNSSLENIPIVDKYNINDHYNRSTWKHWLPTGNSCWNVREEVLFRQAEKDSLIYSDKNGNETKNKDNACSIKSGKWTDPYTGKKYTNPADLDVDHTVSLKAANESGGSSFDPKTKANFANDFDHLVVTSSRVNRAKGAKTPSEWMPKEKKSACDFSKIYTYILTKYGLSITEEDKEALAKGLAGCEY